MLAWLLLSLTLHPIHTTSASLTLAGDGTPGRLIVRVFLEDFPPGRDSAATAKYLADRLTFTTGDRKRIPLVVRRIGESSGVLSVEIGVEHSGSWTGVSVSNQLLCERFPDQVNVIQVKVSAGSRTLLFGPGTPAQPVR